MFAIRQGNWKLCRCPGSGGWTLPDRKAREQGLPEWQLYNLADDPSEQNNRADKEPERLAAMTKVLHQTVSSGRSTPGPTSPQYGAINQAEWPQLVWLPEIPERFVIDD